MKVQHSFSATQQGHGNQYYKIEAKRHLSEGIETHISVSSPKQINIGDCLQIPDNQFYNFIVKEIRSSKPHENRTTPDCKIMDIRVLLIYIGMPKIERKDVTIWEFMKNEGTPIN